MMRGLLFIAFLVLVYYVLKTVLRAAVRGYHDEDRRRPRLMGEDMVLDPECRTYVLKERAVTRRIGGQLHSFCSEACAKQYEEKKRT
jgi:YHS domain-containing protein